MPKPKQLFVSPIPEFEDAIKQITKEETISLPAAVQQGLLERFDNELTKVEALKVKGKLPVKNGKSVTTC